MSLIHTESWMMFEPTTLPAADPGLQAYRTRLAVAMAAAGYTWYSVNSQNHGFVVRPDPLVPERRALVHTAAAAGQLTHGALRFKMPAVQGDIVIGGFSLYVPAAWAPNFTYPYVAHMLFTLSAANAPYVPIQDTTAPMPGEIFRIRFDGGISYASDKQNNKTVARGKQVYIEYRITPTEIRVWMDDVLILQKDVALPMDSFTIYSYAWNDYDTPTGLYGAKGEWAISNFYNVKEDGVAPGVRLGATTRVIGTKPAADDFTQFARPSAFASNAAVVAAPLNPESGASLKTDTVGAVDIYDGAADEATATAGLIHGLNVKVIAQNAEGSPHTMRPLVVSNGTAQGDEKTLPGVYGLVNSVSAIDPNTGAAWTPAAAAISKFGMKLET